MNPQSIDIKVFRLYNGISQEELSGYLGISRQYLSEIENGRSKLTTNKLQTLLDNNKGWDVGPLTRQMSATMQSIGNNSNHNTQVAGGEVEALREKITMLEKLLEEKERTIQILLDRK